MIKQYYQLWVRWGYQPSEFWKTHPTEFWWIVETKVEEFKNKTGTGYAGGMSLAEVESLYDWCLSED